MSLLAMGIISVAVAVSAQEGLPRMTIPLNAYPLPLSQKNDFLVF